MKGLYISSKDDGHDHVVLLFCYAKNIQEDGSYLAGITSKDNGHNHEIIYQPPVQPEVDPATGQMIKPGEPERLVVMDAKGYNHGHNIGEPLRNNIENVDAVKAKEDKQDRLMEYTAIIKDSKDEDDEYLKDAKECEGFYFGDAQWGDDDVNYMLSNDRVRESFNKCDGLVKTILGFYTQNMSFPVTTPVGPDDTGLCDAVNALLYDVYARNDHAEVAGEVMEDLLVTGRGNFLVREGVELDPFNPPVVYERANWSQATYLAHEKRDASDCAASCYSRLITRGYLETITPDDLHKQIAVLPVANNETRNSTGNASLDKIKLTTVQKKEVHSRLCILNSEESLILDGQDGRLLAHTLPKKLQNRILSIPGFEKIKLLVNEYWVGLIAGDDLLISDNLSEISLSTLIPAYGTKRKRDGKNSIKGVLKDILGMQRFVNKTGSVVMEAAMKGSTSAILSEEGAFEDDRQLNQFNQERGKPNAHLRVNDTSKINVQPPIPISNDLVLLQEKFSNYMNEISGVNEEMLGFANSASSGVLYDIRKNSALMQIGYFFKGMELAERSLVKCLVSFFRKNYSFKQVYNILKGVNQQKMSSGGLTIKGQQFINMEVEGIRRIWEDSDFMLHDLQVTRGADTPTKRLAERQMLVDLAKQGHQVLTQIFEMSDLSDDVKAKQIQLSQQSSQQQLALEERKIDSEVNKTQIAAQERNKVALAEIEAKKILDAAKLELERERLEIDKRKVEVEEDLAAAKIRESLRAPDVDI